MSERDEPYVPLGRLGASSRFRPLEFLHLLRLRGDYLDAKLGRGRLTLDLPVDLAPVAIPEPTPPPAAGLH